MDRNALRAEALGCLSGDQPAGVLADCVSRHFADVEAYRENDDLVIRGGGRFLIVRRLGPDVFRVSENVAVPSTNQVESGETERNLDQLIDDISALPR